MAAGPPSLRVGDVLGGKYRVDRIIGAGGIGLVAAATHTDLGKPVAVKVLQQGADAEQRERFLREARAAVRLHSDHVARVLDVGRQPSGAPYMVMELLVGEDLGHVIDRGPLPITDAVDFILQACEGVAEAHAAGIVHRDLKPRNLFLTRRVHGQPLVKILDFGLAKVQTFGDKQLTATQDVMGSPQYMSPEQMRALRDVDLRTDIWSLGVCLYEMLAGGRTPFEAPAVPEIFGRALNMPPWSLLEHRPDAPRGLWDVIQKCLEKDPTARYQSVWELAVALEPFASAPGAAARVLTVLQTQPLPPQEVSEPSIPLGIGMQTQNAFESGDRSKKTFVAAFVGIGVALVLAIAIAGFAYFHDSRPTTQSATATPPPPVTTSVSPTVTSVATPVLEPLATSAKDSGVPAVTTTKVLKTGPTAVATQPKVDAGAGARPTADPNNPSNKF